MAQEDKEIQQLGKLSEVIGAILDEYTKMTEKKDAKNINKNLNDFKSFLDPVKQILEIIKDINIPDVKIDAPNTVRTINKLGSLIRATMRAAQDITIKGMILTKHKILWSVNMLNEVLGTISSINIDPSIKDKTKQITLAVNSLVIIFDAINKIGDKKIPKINLSGLKKNVEIIVKFFEDLEKVKYDKNASHNLALMINDLKIIFDAVCHIGWLSAFIIAFYPLILLATFGVRKLVPQFAQIVKELGGLPDTENAKKAVVNIALVMLGLWGLFFIAAPVALLSALFLPLYPLLMMGIAGFREIAVELDKIPLPQDASILAIWKLGYLIRRITRSMFYMVRNTLVYMMFTIIAPYVYMAITMLGIIMTRVNEIIDAFGKTKGGIKFILMGQITIAAMVRVMRYLRKHIRTFRSIWNNFVMYTKSFSALNIIISLIASILDTFGKVSIGSLIKFMLFAIFPFKRSIDIMRYLNQHSRLINRFLNKAVIYIQAFLMLSLVTKIVYGIKFKRAGIFKTRKAVLKPYKLLLHIMVYLMRHGRTIKKFARKAVIYIPAFLMVQMLATIAAQTILIAITAMVLLTPIMLLFIIASPIIILAVWLFVKVLKIIFRTLGKLIDVKLVLVMLGIVAVVGIMIIIALELAILAITAAMVIANMEPLLEFMLFLIIFAVIIGVIGFIASYVVEFILFAIALFAELMVIVALVLVIAILLDLIAKITLDYDVIKDIVTNIFAIVGMIIWQAMLTLIKNILSIPFAMIGLALSVVLVLMLVVVAGVLWLLSKITLDPEVLMSQVDTIFNSINAIIIKAADFGWSLLQRLPLVALAIAGFVVMVIIVALVVVLAAVLWILSKIPLDEDAVMDNVNKVFRICNHIIETIFNPEDKDGNKSNKSGFMGLLQTIFKAYANIITMVFAVAYLALMVIAVALILLLVGMLKLIEIIPLNADKILTNVDLVIDTCQRIVDRIFAPADDNSKQSSQGGFMGLIKKVLKGLGDIVVAVLGVVYLALMVIAVALILLLVGLLKLIEIIPLNRDKVMQKVNDVIDTCQSIITYLFGSDEEQSNPSSQTGFASLIAKILRGLGDIVMAILGIAYLALMVIAVALILLLVGLLKAIEVIPLKADKIQEKVKLVISTCQSIIESIFYPSDDSENSSSRGIFMDLLYLVCPQYAKIVEAIFTIAYLAVMVIAMALILLIVTILKEIGETDPAIMENAVNIAISAVAACQQIIDMLFKPDDADQSASSRGVMMSLISFFSPELANILEALFAIAYLALAMIAMNIVVCIAKKLYELGKLDPSKFAKAKKMAIEAVNASNDIIAQVFATDNSKEKKKKGFLRKILEWVLGEDMMQLIDALLAVGKLATMVMAVQAIGKLAILLTRVANFKFSRDQVVSGARRVTSAASALISYVLEGASKVSKKEAKKVQAYFDSFGNVANQISRMCQKFKISHTWSTKATPWIDSCTDLIKHMNNTIADIEYEGVADKIDAVRTCLNKYTGIVNQIIYILERLSIASSYNAPREMVDGLNDIIRDINGVKVDEQHVRNIADLIEYVNTKISSITKVTAQDVKYSKELTDNYVKFLDKIDKSDFNKLNVTERMLAHWADLAHQVRGDFEGMANAINQHMMPMLETLNQTMTDVNECQKKIMDELSVDNSGGGENNVTVNEGDSSTSVNENNGGSSTSSSVNVENTQNEYPSTETAVTQPQTTTGKEQKNLTENVAANANQGQTT